jgi:hypothetical protein
MLLAQVGEKKLIRPSDETLKLALDRKKIVALKLLDQDHGRTMNGGSAAIEWC